MRWDAILPLLHQSSPHSPILAPMRPHRKPKKDVCRIFLDMSAPCLQSSDSRIRCACFPVGMLFRGKGQFLSTDQVGNKLARSIIRWQKIERKKRKAPQILYALHFKFHPNTRPTVGMFTMFTFVWSPPHLIVPSEHEMRRVSTHTLARPGCQDAREKKKKTRSQAFYKGDKGPKNDDN